jgi:hypothetical protein
MIDRRLVHRRIGCVFLINDEDLIPALVLRHELADLAQLFAEDRRRDRAVALPIACPTQACCGVHDHKHCRKPDGARQPSIVRPAHRIKPQGVDHGRQGPFGACRDDLVEDRERLD